MKRILLGSMRTGKTSAFKKEVDNALNELSSAGGDNPEQDQPSALLAKSQGKSFYRIVCNNCKRKFNAVEIPKPQICPQCMKIYNQPTTIKVDRSKEK